ncbi:DnaJ domain-containing protein [Earliella scabrosa]|nr:DnaJ domain-containing protein [Earliella scabrosa]
MVAIQHSWQRSARTRHPQFPHSAIRYFSQSSSRSGHYQTLGIPKNATKNQIKASYYKLSKQFHPDINKDPEAKTRFQAVSEAYAVLGDERQRRSYDRSVTQHNPSHPHTHHEASHTHWSYEGRRRGATHAWEYARRPNTSRHYTYPPPPGSSPFSHTHHQHPASGPNPFANPNVQRATGRRGPLPTDRGPTQADYVARESMFVRTIQVAALVLLIATVGHGFSASA